VSNPPGEVQTAWFTDPTTLAWDTAAGATTYNVYRGQDIDLPKLATGETDSCLHGTSSGSSLGSITVTPSQSRFDWWLVRASNSAGEGPAGSSTQGPRLQEPSGVCP
jgi:hypothetical protein